MANPTKTRSRSTAESGTPEQIITGWIEKNLGGTIVSIERQKRWRPAWFVDVRHNNDIVSLCIRGDRRASPFCRIAEEYKIQKLLQQGGIRVPHVYGFIDELPAMVMAKVPGKGMGLLYTQNSADKLAIQRQYAEQLARVHSLDTEPFRKIGMDLPTNGRDTIMAYMDKVCGLYAEFRKQRGGSDPRIDFLIGWINRNVPDRDIAPCFALIDAGQFMSHGGELTAIIDFELSLLGDPMNDLGALRFRSQAEPIGDIENVYRAYSEFTGKPIDYELVRFQTLLFISASTILAHMLHEDYMQMFDKGGNYVEYLTWVYWGYRQAMEVICEIKGYKKPQLEEPQTAQGWIMDCLAASGETVKQIETDDEFARYQLQLLNENIAYMKRVAMYGPSGEQAYTSDVKLLTGTEPGTWLDADQMLETYIHEASPDDDEQLIRVMHRDMSRRCFCLATPNSQHHAGLLEAMPPIGAKAEAERP